MPGALRRGGPHLARATDGDRAADRRAGRRGRATTTSSSRPGSVSRTLPIPGLRENAVGFKTIGEAIWLRNHVLDRLDVAATTVDKETRRRALTFVFVGGGYAGIEALAEMEDMARDALRYYDELDAGRHALGAGRGDPAGAARGRPGHGRVHGGAAAPPGHGHPARAPGSSPVWTVWSSCPTGTPSRPTPSCGRPGSSRRRCWTRPTFRATTAGRITCLPTLQVVGPDGVGRAGCLERRRLRGRARPQPPTCPGRCARRAPSTPYGRRRRLADNIRAMIRGGTPKELLAQARRLGGEPRPAQGRGPGVRDQAAGLVGLVHAPDLPPEPRAEPQPQDPGGGGLDARAVPAPRGGLAG